MPNIAPIQNDFSSGEISPRLRGKSQSRVYSSGLNYCENFVVTPQGTIEKRKGSQWIIDTEEESGALHTFDRLGANDDVVMIGENNVTVYDRSGIVISTGGANLITDPKFLFGFDEWVKFTQTDDIGFGGTKVATATAISNVGTQLRVRTESDGLEQTTAFARVRQTITMPTQSATYNFKATAVFQSASNETRGGTLGIQIRRTNGNGVIAEVYDFNADNGSPNRPLPAIGEEFDFEINADMSPWPADTQFRIEIIALNNFQNRDIKVLFKDLVVTEVGVPPVLAQFPTPTSWAGKIGQVQTAMDSASGRMIFTVLDGDMHELDYDRDLDNWEFTPFEPITLPSDRWAGDQPSVCAFHQGRLWLAANPTSPSTLYASETWNYDNFEFPAPADPFDPSDPMEFTLSINGQIQWLLGLKTLLVGSDVGQAIGRSQGAVITSQDFAFSVEQKWSSAYRLAITSGRQGLFISNDFARVRSLYDGGDQSDSYLSQEPSLIAEHLTSPKITELAYAQNPLYQLSALREAGDIVESTYYEAIEANGWYRKTTQGIIEAMTIAEDSGGSSQWILVDRGDGILQLEVFNAALPVPIYQDSYVRRTAFLTTVSGLDHLEGQDVTVVVLDCPDGEDICYAVHPNRVVTGGVIELEYWASGADVAVGLAYNAKLITNEIEGSNPTGTAFTQKRRFNEIFARLYDSGMPIINGTRTPSRVPADLMSSAVPLQSGDFSVSDAGYNNGVVTVEQDLPVPTNISALFGKAKGSQV